MFKVHAYDVTPLYLFLLVKPTASGVNNNKRGEYNTNGGRTPGGPGDVSVYANDGEVDLKKSDDQKYKENFFLNFLLCASVTSLSKGVFLNVGNLN